jgi:SAM-dependent methyltransferase
MRTVLNLSNKKEFDLPGEFKDDDNRFPESFARHFIEEFTKDGDIVFDPFAGYGTTLRVAEALGRVGYGTEFDKRKVEYVRTTLKNPENLILGNALEISALDIPGFDFSLTSPLYMHRDDENPFKTNILKESSYRQYLSDIESVYTQIRDKLKEGGKAIIEVSNLKKDGAVTPLAWDIAQTVSQVLEFQGEIVINWEGGYGYGYDHGYALIFQK